MNFKKYRNFRGLDCMVVLCIQYCQSFFFCFFLFMFNFIVNFVSVIFSVFCCFFLGGGVTLVFVCLFAISINQAKIILKYSIYKSYYVSEHKIKSGGCIYVICKRIKVKVQCMLKYIFKCVV